MKKSIQKWVFFALLTLAGAASSCQTQQPDGSQYAPEPQLGVDKSHVDFTYKGGDAVITVKDATDLLVSSEKPWVNLVVSGDRVQLSVGENNSLESRYSVITIVEGHSSARVQVVQLGMNSEMVWDDVYTVPYEGGSLQLAYNTDATVKVDVTGSDWISVVVDDKAGVLRVTVASNPYNVARDGKLGWTAGDESRTVSIHQKPNPDGKDPE